MRIVIGIARVVVLAAALVAPAGGAPAHGGATEHTVRSVAFTYVLPETRIARGDSVALENYDRDLHTITARDERHGKPLFDTTLGVPLLGRGRVEGVQALTGGIYRYYCRLHPTAPTMFGRIIVQ